MFGCIRWFTVIGHKIGNWLITNPDFIELRLDSRQESPRLKIAVKLHENYSCKSDTKKTKKNKEISIEH